MLYNDSLILILTVIIFIFIVFISMKTPFILVAIYPLTFISATQSMFSIGGISPSKYIGIILIINGLLFFGKKLRARQQESYSHFKLLFILLLFPLWIFVRFLVEGSDIDWPLTFLLNALSTFSIIILTNTKNRNRILEISLGFTFALSSLGVILAFFFQPMDVFRIIQDSDVTRAIGFFDNPNYGGAFIVIGLIFFLSKSILYYNTKRKRYFYYSLALVVLSIFSLVLTFSRMAILSAVACFLMMIFFGKIGKKNIGWIFLLVILLFVIYNEFSFVSNGLEARFSIITSDNSNINRLRIFQEGIAVISNNFLLGTGIPNGYHNSYLNIIAFGGIIGFMFLFLPIVINIIFSIKILTISNEVFQDRARFALFGILNFLIMSFSTGLERDRLVWLVFGYGILNFVIYNKLIRGVQVKNIRTNFP